MNVCLMLHSTGNYKNVQCNQTHKMSKYIHMVDSANNIFGYCLYGGLPPRPLEESNFVVCEPVPRKMAALARSKIFLEVV